MDDEVCRGRAAEWWTCVVGETCFFDDECCGCGAENEKECERQEKSAGSAVQGNLWRMESAGSGPGGGDTESVSAGCG